MQANLRRLSLKGSIIILLLGCRGYGQSGFPGNPPAPRSSGHRIYPLAQSYMPAQDIHVVVNPRGPALSPWYRVDGSPEVITPEWTFSTSQLRSWPKTIGGL